MKRQSSLFLIFTFLAISLVWAQGDSQVTWPDWVNAYTWDKWDFNTRYGYILGFLHGNLRGTRLIIETIQDKKLLTDEQVIQVLNASHKNSPSVIAGGTRFIQMMDGISEFHKDYANKDIPVFMLLPVVCKRVKGEIKQEDIEKELKKLRQQAQKIKEARYDET